MKLLVRFITALIILITLVGCGLGGMAYSPQQAALQQIKGEGDPNMVIDQNTIQVRQTMQIGRTAYVVISFSQKANQMQNECVFVYESTQNNIGAWTSSGGGGGCTGWPLGDPKPQPMPVDSASGSSGGRGPADPGSSYHYGLVNQADIVKIRVTWADAQQQEAAVINGSYLAVRVGMLNAQKIEGLNANDEIVYSMDFPAAPGQP